MGAALNIFNLYALEGLADLPFMIVGAMRPAYSNASQPEEDRAVAEVLEAFRSAVTMQQQSLGFTSWRRVATWEDGFPEGDSFYGEGPDGRIDVWLTLDTRHAAFFAFGAERTEEEFWANMKELHDSGDLWTFDEFARPAARASVWFHRAKDPASIAAAKA